MPSLLTKQQIDLAKTLRAQQVPWKDIAAQTGAKEATLRTFGSRNKWSHHVASVERAIASVAIGRVTDRINAEIDECIAGAIELAKEGLNGLRSNKTKGMKPKDLREYAGALKELVAVQRQALGMGDKVGTQINIGIVDQGGFDTPIQGNETPPGQQTIDVESV